MTLDARTMGPSRKHFEKVSTVTLEVEHDEFEDNMQIGIAPERRAKKLQAGHRHRPKTVGTHHHRSQRWYNKCNAVAILSLLSFLALSAAAAITAVAHARNTSTQHHNAHISASAASHSYAPPQPPIISPYAPHINGPRLCSPPITPAPAQPLPPSPHPPPSSPSPPRLPAPSLPLPHAPLIWTKYKHHNCYWDGNGASVEIEQPRGSAAPHIATIEECKNACHELYPTCEGILVSSSGQCFRKGGIDAAKCRSDSNMDLYLLSAAMPPGAPKPPFHPVPRAVQQINDRFRNGGPRDRLGEVGLLLHQWDGLEAHDRQKPWEMCIVSCMCQGSFIHGRISAMAIYRGLKERPDRIAIPLPFGNRGGLVLNPEYTTLECLYGIDGATYHLDDASKPGCTDKVCDPSHPMTHDGLCGLSGYPPTAWLPRDLKLLLEMHAEHGAPYKAPAFHSGYNELILNSAKFNQQLPQAILAFFYLKGGAGKVTDDLGYGIVIDAVATHQAFLDEYGLSEEQVPLLELDPSNWDQPFSVVTS